jgi:probable phosphoglycerate mutase
VIQQNFLTDRLRSAEIPTFIYFVRHGETILTPQRKFSGTGSLDPELMQEGLDQADLVAEECAKLGAEVLIASPLNRTRQTAEAISRATGLEIIFDKVWYELSFGSWDGKAIEEVREEEPDNYQAWLNSSSYAPPGGGESYDEASIRIEEALEKLVAEYPGKKIIVVTHNGIVKTAAKLAVGGPSDAVFHMDATPCSISSISIWPSDGLRALRSFNERGHLR